MLGEQCEKIRLPVHHADHPHPVEGPRHLGAVPKSLDPAIRLLLFPRGHRSRLRRVQLRPQHPQRQPRLTHHQRRVQMQSPRRRSRLVAPDHPQSLTPAVPREVQIAPVLDAQHRPLPLHPLPGPLPVRGQDVGHRHRRGFRLVDQPVVSLDRRRIAPRHSRERPPRLLRLTVRTLHQSPTQAPVSQRRPAQLLLSPALSLQSLALRHRFHSPPRRRSHPQPPTPIPAQLIPIDRLARLRTPVRPILPASTLRLPQNPPVRGAQTGPIVASRLHEGLHQPGSVTVARLELRTQPPQHLPQHPGGQITTPH